LKHGTVRSTTSVVTSGHEIVYLNLDTGGREGHIELCQEERNLSLLAYHWLGDGGMSPPCDLFCLLFAATWNVLDSNSHPNDFLSVLGIISRALGKSNIQPLPAKS
jgi:hypothetical protein